MKKSNRDTFQIVILLISAFSVVLTILLAIAFDEKLVMENSEFILTLATVLVTAMTVVYTFMSFRRIRPKQSIFLSYADQDKELASLVATTLNSQLHHSSKYRFEIFTVNAVPYGDSIRETIEHFINSSDIVIVLLSPNYLCSDWCMKELSMALSAKKKVIPIIANSNIGLPQMPNELNDIKALLLTESDSDMTLEQKVASLAKDLIRQRKD